MSWRGRSQPTASALVCGRFLEQAIMHIAAIKNSGVAVLGNRPLEMDGLEPWTFINGTTIQKGFNPVRKSRRDDNDRLPALSWWGYDVIQIKAHNHFLSPTGNPPL